MLTKLTKKVKAAVSQGVALEGAKRNFSRPPLIKQGLVFKIILGSVIICLIILVKRNLEPQEIEAFRLWAKSPRGELLIKAYLALLAVTLITTFWKQIKWVFGKFKIQIHKCQIKSKIQKRK